MNISGIQSPFLINQTTNQSKPKLTPAEAQDTFKAALSEAIQNVNSLQKESAGKTQLLAKGEIDNLHNVLITGQKSSITLQATVEVRNKVVEAYQEIMRMQV